MSNTVNTLANTTGRGSDQAGSAPTTLPITFHISELQYQKLTKLLRLCSDHDIVGHLILLAQEWNEFQEGYTAEEALQKHLTTCDLVLALNDVSQAIKVKEVTNDRAHQNHD